MSGERGLGNSGTVTIIGKTVTVPSFVTGVPRFVRYIYWRNLKSHNKKRKGSSMKITKILLSLVACGLAFSGLAVAQNDDSHGLITACTTTVKAGKGQEFRELQGQLVAARKAAGHSGVTAWQVVRGPSSTFYTVTSADNHADLAGPFDSGMSDRDWQRWIGRITDIIDHSTVMTLRTHGELTIAAEPGSAPNVRG